MKIKRVVVVLCSVVMLCGIPVFAQEQNTQYTQPIQYVSKEVEVRNGIITFITKSEQHNNDCRCQPEAEITIKENKAGLLKDGDVIYFHMGECNDIYIANENLEIAAKGLTAKEIDSEKENDFAIRIEREDITQPAEINIDFYTYTKSAEQEYNKDNSYTFPLYLDTDREKQNNVLIQQENVLLNENFVKLLNGSETAQKLEQQRQQKLEQIFPQIVFFVDKNIMTWNGVQRELEHSVYINEKGVAMLDLEYLVYIAQNLDNTCFSYFENGVYTIMAGKNVVYIDTNYNSMKNIQGEQFQNILEQKDDVYYMSVRDVAKIFGLQQYVIWDNNTKTITIK